MSTSRRAAMAVFLCTCGWLRAAGPPAEENDAALTKQVELTAEERIQEALKQPVNWEFPNVTLNDAISKISDDHQINIVIDSKALADAGVDLESPIDVKLKDIPLKKALHYLLRELDLAWLIENEVLLITTRDVADTRLIVKAYPVADLLVVRDQFGRPDELLADQVNEEELPEMIANSLHADEWEQNGGAGNMMILRGTLVVSNTWEVHEQVEQMLAALPKARTQQFVADAASRYLPIRVDEGDESAVARRIRAALQSKVKWDFDETPLDAIAASLSATHGVAVLLDMKALGDAGVDAESPLTLEVDGITLASALPLLLREPDLAFHVADDVLHITTRDIEDTTSVTRAYPVRDLVVNLETGESDFESLISLIQNTVAPDVWEANGGAGNIEPFAGSLCLIVNTTHEVHDRVLKLLTDLRADPTYKEPPLTPEAAGDGDDKVRLRAYYLDRGPSAAADVIPLPVDRTPEEVQKYVEATTFASRRQNQEIVDLVKEVVEPTAWEQDGVFIKALSDRIVVNHNGRIHKLVRKALLEMEVLSPYRPGDSYYGGGPLQSVIPVVGQEMPRPKPDRPVLFFGGATAPPAGIAPGPPVGAGGPPAPARRPGHSH